MLRDWLLFDETSKTCSKKIDLNLYISFVSWESNKGAGLNNREERIFFKDFFKQADPKSCVLGGEKNLKILIEHARLLSRWE